MKYLITILIAVMFIVNGCDKKTTESNEDETDLKSYSTLDVKENTDYFNFATNSGSTDANSDYDIMFYHVMWQPAQEAPIIPDPRFVVKNGLSAAVLEKIELEDINEVPESANFIANFISEKGEWYDETSAHVIIPIEKVYIVNTTDGKFPAFQITGYYDELGESGVLSFNWKYLSE